MNESDKILFAKYITGQSSPEETSMVKYLINNSKEHEELYVGMYEAWQSSIQYDLDSIDPERAYSSFLINTVKPAAPLVRFISRSGLAIAASVLLICSLGFFYYQTYLSSGNSTELIVQNEINVPKGSTLKTVLSDGTKVWINAGSTLKFNPDFGVKTRTVYLSGEAYFDIAKGSVPFIVKTEHHTIRDIGTTFNVKAYADDLSFETTVIEGEVSIEGKVLIDSDKTQTISVKKQQVFKLNYAPPAGLSLKNNRLSDIVEVKVQKISSAQVEDYTGWTEDLLVFEGKTFQEIIKIMERRYDVEIIMEDIKLRNYEFTGSFKNIDEVGKALKILRKTTDINYEIQGRIIRIHENTTPINESL